MRTFILIFISFLSASLFAQRTEKVTKTIVYHAEGYQSVEEAKLMAIEEAKAMAMDSVFGTNVHGRSASVVQVGNGNTVEQFVHINSSDVRGRWIRHLKEPEFGRIWYEQNMLNVTITVRGIVREILSAPIDCKVKVLCDGTDADNERDDFKNGNNIYLSFMSPVDGYLVVYLVDDKLDAYCALPYYNQKSGAYKIEANQEYIFFSERDALAADRPFVEQYKLVTDKDIETNQLYVIFSPNKFTKPVDTSIDPLRPRQLSWKNFQSWLNKCMNHDDDMIGEMPIVLHITK